MNGIMEETTIDLGTETDDEVSYPNPDISINTEDDPESFQVDDDDHDIARRDATPRSTILKEPVASPETKRKRTDESSEGCFDELPSSKRSDIPSLLSLHHLDTGEIVPQTQIWDMLSASTNLHRNDIDSIAHQIRNSVLLDSR